MGSFDGLRAVGTPPLISWTRLTPSHFVILRHFYSGVSVDPDEVECHDVSFYWLCGIKSLPVCEGLLMSNSLMHQTVRKKPASALLSCSCSPATRTLVLTQINK